MVEAGQRIRGRICWPASDVSAKDLMALMGGGGQLGAMGFWVPPGKQVYKIRIWYKASSRLRELAGFAQANYTKLCTILYICQLGAVSFWLDVFIRRRYFAVFDGKIVVRVALTFGFRRCPFSLS